MTSIKEKATFWISAIVYFLFNLRVSSTFGDTVVQTLWQLLQTVPFVGGVTWLIIAILQYMANGEKMPWDRRFRIFFALGIMVGLFWGIYEYAGVAPGSS